MNKLLILWKLSNTHYLALAKIAITSIFLMISFWGCFPLINFLIRKDPNAFLWNEETWRGLIIIIWILLFFYTIILTLWITHPLLRPIFPYILRGKFPEAFYKRVHNKHKEYCKAKCNFQDFILYSLGSAYKIERNEAINYLLLVGFRFHHIKVIINDSFQSHILDEFERAQNKGSWLSFLLISYMITTIIIIALVLNFGFASKVVSYGIKVLLPKLI